MGIPLLVSMIQSDRERLHRLSIERKEISSEDGKIKVTVFGMWARAQKRGHAAGWFTKVKRCI
jgi:hypothetical protein